MSEYRCTRCAYIYVESEGDPTADVMPGTRFDKLPTHWACLHCGMEKEHFEPLFFDPTAVD